MDTDMIQFRFRPDKAAEAIDLIARRRPGLTQYFLGKTLYLSDKKHLLDWGRPITFDRYVAMKHGPVPSAVRNMVAAAAGAMIGMDEERYSAALQNTKFLTDRVRVELEVARNGERHSIYPTDDPIPFYYLSGSDIDCLEAVILQSAGMSFGALREETHKDDAWAAAWNHRGRNSRSAPIDVSLWADPEDRDAVREDLAQYASVAA